MVSHDLVKEVIARYKKRLRSEEARRLSERLRLVEKEIIHLLKNAIEEIFLPALSDKEVESALPWMVIYDTLETGMVESEEEAKTALLEKYGSAKRVVRAFLEACQALGYYGEVDTLYYTLCNKYGEVVGDAKRVVDIDEQRYVLLKKRDELEAKRLALAPLKPYDPITLENLIALIVVVHDIVEELKKEQEKAEGER